MRSLALGVGSITDGTLLVGFTFELLGVSVGLELVVEGLFLVAGLMVIAPSLWIR